MGNIENIHNAHTMKLAMVATSTIVATTTAVSTIRETMYSVH